MTPEQLLMPRYEVINNYPGSKTKIGEILINDKIASFGLRDQEFYNYCIENNYLICDMPFINEYPHLFRKINW